MESNCYRYISESQRQIMIKPHNEDRVYYSELENWYSNDSFRSFSIKCVLRNSVFYQAGAAVHEVKSGSYLVSLKEPDVISYVRPDQLIKSICVDVSQDTLNEVYTILTDRGDQNLDNYLSRYFRQPEFVRNIFDIHSSAVGTQLLSLANKVENEDRNNIFISREWLYELVEKIVCSEFQCFEKLKTLNYSKLTTKKEVCQRVSRGKYLIDTNVLSINSIEYLAQYCNMSKYHFFRSFKAVFGVSPYQYILHKRLELSRSYLHQNEHSIGFIAGLCGFRDIFCYSKAFKKVYGLSPSQFRSSFSLSGVE